MDEMYVYTYVGWRSCKCHHFTFNPFCFQNANPGWVRMSVHNINMLLRLFRRTVKRGTCVCPQRNIHASRAHRQYTHLLTTLLYYLAQYSTTLEGYVQYYYYSNIIFQFSPFHFRSLLSAWQSQLVAYPRSSARNQRLFQVWDLQEDTHTTVDCSMVII